MSIGISAIGTAVPKYKRTQAQTAELIADVLNLKPVERKRLKSIYQATQIKYRHSVLKDYLKKPGHFSFFPNDTEEDFPSTAARMQIYQTEALKLALAAIKNCLTQQKIFNKQEITHLITVSCTGMYAPGLDIEIIENLKLNTNTKRVAINFMGCYAAFNAMEVAYNICKANAKAKVLIVCVELCTLHFQKNKNLENIISNAIFADGAAAALIENTQKQAHLEFMNFHCDLLPQSQDKMAWKIADQGFDIVLSHYVPDLIEKGIHKFIQNFIAQNKIKNLDFYAIHPGGVKILKACEQALNIDPQKNKYAYEVLQNYGNMSSVTILFVLKILWQNLKTKDHNKTILACAFGPGLTIQASLLKTMLR